MIWNLMHEATLSSNEDGTEAVHIFDVQGFGLEVDEVVVGVEVTARSSESVQVRVHQEYGVSQNSAAFITTAADVIATTPVTGNLPLTILGASVLPAPFFLTTLGVSSLSGTRESVTVSVYVGGRRR